MARAADDRKLCLRRAEYRTLDRDRDVRAGRIAQAAAQAPKIPSTKLAKPAQFGPMTAMPRRSAASTSSRWRSLPSGPTSP